ncbi:MAG: ABC transporter ATP-binding protein [Actinomycetales bacterium]|nr:ABC transporter ATP-binding protein [Actinomycetales bacterium]
MTALGTDSAALDIPPQRPTDPSPVELVDVVKDYGELRALEGLSLSLAPGEFVALLGPSGCGKTTALRALAGLEGITSGRILIGGEDVAALPTNRRDLGMVFQAYSLFPHMTVRENVEYGLRMRRVPRDERRERAREALALVGLEGREDRFAHQLSGGQQQRVALARALVTRPRVLLLDEPLSALDAKVRVALRDQIRRIQTELRITTLFVTHDQEEALAVADRVAVMNRGRIEQIGTPEELYTSPATAFVADFVGLSNRIPATLHGRTVTAYGTDFALLGEDQPAGEVLAFVRPEDVLFATRGGVPGEVVSSSFLGSLRRTTVRLEDGVLVSVQHAASESTELGRAVRLAFRGGPVSAAPR